MLEQAKMIEFIQRGDENGYLVALESNKEVPFEIKRVFYVYGTVDGVVRGQHSNRKSEFVLVNLAGSSKVKVDYGDKEEIYLLDKPNKGLYIPRMLWKDMYDFSSDAVLLVLSNEPYDADEYIRDKQEYYKEIGVLK